jgi:hypothetical protein
MMKYTDTYQDHVTSWNVHVSECWFLTPVNSDKDYIPSDVFLYLQNKIRTAL